MRHLALFATALAALPAGQALAHAQLVKADPAVGSTVARAPSQLRLRFDQVIRLGASGVMLTTPGGGRLLLVPLAHDPADPRAVTAPLPAAMGPGRYQVQWRALSPDGHRTQGDFAFSVGP